MIKTILNTKISEVENKIPNTNTKINEVENKISNHAKFIFIPEFNTLTADNFPANLKQAD